MPLKKYLTWSKNESDYSTNYKISINIKIQKINMFNFLNKLEAKVKDEEVKDGSAIVDTSYTKSVEAAEIIDYTFLLNENEIEWKREEVEEAKNKFELVKDQLPEDFTNKSYEERMEIVNQIIETLE